MTIGGSIALIVIGAILAFAVTFDIAGLSINTIGFILMLGGLVGLVLGVLAYQRTAAVSATTVRREPVASRRRVVERPVASERVVERPVASERVVEDREIL
jgi:hypothetical protein